MALRNVTNRDDPRFRKISRPVEHFDERLWNLPDDMKDTLSKAGVYGCAAVHVGILRRVVVILDESGIIELVNPVVIDASEETKEVQEGSIAVGVPRGKVNRPKSVTVEGFDRHGKPITVTGKGFLAATLLHEIDHLDGVLFTDKMEADFK
jgi:peptide deformylase